MAGTPILIVDDDARSRRALSTALQRHGFAVLEADGGRQAIEILEARGPMLLVLDYEMPGLNGAQVCERIRRHPNPQIAALPIIMLTAHTGSQHEIECLHAGANDFASKPVNTAILEARIETHLRLHALRAQTERRNAELERDLEAARLTQQAILPARLPAIAGWEISACYQPVIQVGGDIYDWQPQPGGSWLFWMADATGHGASAALLTTLTKLVFRHAASESRDPAVILQAVNSDFFAIFKGRFFITAACLCLEPAVGRLRFAGAGHPPLVLQRAGSSATIASQNPPIGVVRHLPNAADNANLAQGDLALLYTDGLFSSPGPGGGHRAPEDLLPLLPQDAPSSEAFLDALIRRVATGGPLPDDMAAIVLRRC